MNRQTGTGFARGFTLIELLVVIAIIGVLSAIVLASLSMARSRAADASTKASVDVIRKQAAVYYLDNDGKYGSGASATMICEDTATMFAGDPTIKRAIDAIKKNSPTVYCRMVVGATDWGFFAALAAPSPGNGGVCIDSTGMYKEIPTPAGPIKICP